jgi:Domain of unknown function (DUF5666)
VAIAHLDMRLLSAILVAIVVAACGNSSASLDGPSGVSRANGAVITGRVSGVSLRASTLDGTASTTGSAAAATTLRVTINGTNISTMVDGAGQFTMNGVPPGTVTLTFTGEGVSASLTLNNVNAGDEIRIEVRLNGNSARIESETRRQGGDDEDDDDADRDEANEVEGTVSALSGTCPAVTFTVGTRVVKTGNATVFEDPCTGIRNGVRVEVRGTRASDGTFTAARVELDD